MNFVFFCYVDVRLVFVFSAAIGLVYIKSNQCLGATKRFTLCQCVYDDDDDDNIGNKYMGCHDS